MEVCARVYRPRRARESPLFRLVETHLEGLLRVWPERFQKLPVLGIRLAGSSAEVGAGTAQASLIQLLIVGVGLALGAGRLRRGSR